MPAIVGDKLKLTNYAYILDENGTGWHNPTYSSANVRDGSEKLIDAFDIDWRPYAIKHYAYIGDLNPTLVTLPGDLWETGRLIDFISYAYSINSNFSINELISPNRIVNPDVYPNPNRPTMLTNITWDTTYGVFSYAWWPSVGSVYDVTTFSDFDHFLPDDALEVEREFAEQVLNQKRDYINYPEKYGEVFNDYKYNKANALAHAEGNITYALGYASHAEGYRTATYGDYSHAEGSYSFNIGNSSHVEGTYAYVVASFAHAEGGYAYVIGDFSHAEGLFTNAYGVASHTEGSETLAYSYAHAEGFNTIARNYSHAEGLFSEANASYSHTEGSFTVANSDSSHAEGHFTYIVDGIGAHTEGSYSYANGLAAHAEGINTYAFSEGAHAEGLNTIVINSYSHAEGCFTYANAIGAHIEGILTYSSGDFSHVEGATAYSYASYSHVEGFGSVAYEEAIGAHVEGRNSYSFGEYSHTEGVQTATFAEGAHAEGILSAAFEIAAHAEGNSTYAFGSGTHSEGTTTEAHGVSSHAEGFNSKTNAMYSHAEGFNTKTIGGLSSGFAAHAEGGDTTTYGNYSHSEGNFTTTYGAASHAEGNSTISYGEYSHAEGRQTYSLAESSHAEGLLANAYGVASHAEGNSTISYGEYSHAEGRQTYSLAESSHAEGLLANAYGVASHAEGFNTYAAYDYSHAEGRQTFAYNVMTHVEGCLTYAVGIASHAEGWNTFAIASYSHAEGRGTTSSGEDAHAESHGTTASGFYSHAEGNGTIAAGIAAHAEGWVTSATALTAHAEGHKTIAEGSGSHAEGFSTRAVGSYSHTEGSETTAEGFGSHAEGLYTSAVGSYSHTEGSETTAEGIASHAGGFGSIAFGPGSFAHGSSAVAGNTTNGYAIAFGTDVFAQKSYSIAIGYNLQTSNNCEIALGKYNLSKPGYIFEIGDGTIAGINTFNHNAIEITYTGWTYISKLASYVNVLTMSDEHKFITYDSNFVNVYSIGSINRTGTNTYDFHFNTYSLPTKNYVDKLLEAKDVFRFCGTITFEPESYITFPHPDNTVPPASNNLTGITWSPTFVKTEYSETGINYSYVYSYNTGSIWKATNSGWFGNRYCQSGDLILSYSDLATHNTDYYWAIIDTHINFVENYGTNNTNQFEKNRVLTNVHFSDSGQLTYSYANVVTTYVGNENVGFLSNISLKETKNTIEITYTHSGFVTVHDVAGDKKWNLANNATQKSPRTNEQDAISFISDVNLDQIGYLHYSYYTINNFKNHHFTEEAEELSISLQTGLFSFTSYESICDDYTNAIIPEDKCYIVSNINLSTDGHLSYSYLTLNYIKGHHNTFFPNNDITHTVDNAETNGYTDSIRVVRGVNLSKRGTLTYSYLTLNGLRYHHHNLVAYDRGETDVHSNDNLRVVTYTYINSDGTFYSAYNTLSHLASHHHTLSEIHNTDSDGRKDAHNEHDINLAYANTSSGNNATASNRNLKILSYVWINSSGYLQAYYYNVSNIRRHHGTYSFAYNTTTDVNDNDTLKFTYAYSIDLDDYGYLTYRVSTYTMTGMRDHHHTNTEISNNENGGRTDKYSEREIDLANEDTSSDSSDSASNRDLKVLTYAWINSSGYLQSYTNTIKNIRRHHGTYVSFGYAYNAYVSKTSLNGDKIGFISAVKLDDYGYLSYQHSSIDGLRNHHRTTYVTGATTYDVYTNADTKPGENKGDNAFGFISNIYLTNYGELCYQTSSVTDLRTHHSQDHSSNTYTIHSTDKQYDTTKDVDKIGFIGEIHLNKYGYLTYVTSSVDRLRTHHDNNGTLIDNHTIDVSNTSHDNIFTFTYIANVNLTSYGYLTYAYSSYTLTNIRNHHSNTTGSVPTVSAIDLSCVGSAGGVNAYTVAYINNVNLTNDGKLTYTYGHITIKDSHQHHSNAGSSIANGSINVNGNNTENVDNFVFTYIANIKLSSTGELAYEYSSYTITNLRNHHSGSYTTSINQTPNFGEEFNIISKVSLSSAGNLSGESKTVEIPDLTTYSYKWVGTAPNQFVRTIFIQSQTGEVKKVGYVYDDIWGTI